MRKSVLYYYCAGELKNNFLLLTFIQYFYISNLYNDNIMVGGKERTR